MASDSYLSPVPNLTTALSNPLESLEVKILENQIKIETWLRDQWRLTTPPITSSVDLRNAGFKCVPVDTNLFPAGFNNLNRDFFPLCIQALQATIEKEKPGCRRVLLIPESHTRNTFYFENLGVLHELLTKAGYLVKVGSLSPEITHPHRIQTQHSEFDLEPIVRLESRLLVGDFKPCLTILNNDLSSGIPDILKDLDETIRPSLLLGWSNRQKSVHFKHYRDVAAEFSEVIGIDPWLITPEFRVCDHVDFLKFQGEENIQQATKEVLELTHQEYQTRQIDAEPFVAIKANAGTYGMGVMTVNSVEELQHLNRKQRKQMSMTKGNLPIHEVLIQEGVHSFETIGPESSVAEPVVYMIGPYVVGGFYRVNQSRSETENLNAPGMYFNPLAFATSCNMPDSRQAPNACPNRFYMYGVIARLASLAAAREESA